ncbi:hypothetical protein ACP70R_032371 [Stipagrostis hirtigluma subsp. patula]
MQEVTSREEIDPAIHLGFVGESEKQPMETEGGGLAATSAGKKRPPPSATPGEDEDSSTSTTDDDESEWLVSDSGSEEDDEDQESKGPYHPFTVDDIPRVSCDFGEQSAVMFLNPKAKLQGPLPIRLFPAFNGGKHVFGSDYNLGDTSEISVINVGDCSNECRCRPMDLLQFIDIKIAGYRHTHPGRAKIFGFIAARDTIEPLRNYVYKRGIENCEAVSVKRKTGVARLSLTSPARVISMSTRALLEFALHAESEDEANGDDLIIEGCTELEDLFATKSFIEHRRLYSTRCALDVKFAVVINAVEARVDIEALHVPTHGIDLKLCAKTSGFSDVIRLFHGSISEASFFTSFAIAVKIRSYLNLYIGGSPRGDLVLDQKSQPGSWWQHSFGSGFHGKQELVANLGDFASFLVKVTWKSYRRV